MKHNRRVAVLILVALLPTVACSQQAKNAPAPPAAPKSLLIYYWYPSLLNNAKGNVALAATEFAKYDYVVLGDGLQDSTHKDHINTVNIIKQAKAKNKTIQFFGYIPLSNRANVKEDKRLTQDVINARVNDWAKMGVVGILLDEFGYDYGVTRARQNASVAAAHGAKLRVIANAWNPDDVFLADPTEGVKPVLNKDDIYLWESYRFKEGAPVDLKEWRAKADQIVAGRKAVPLAVFSVSTNVAKPAMADALFAHQSFCAAIDGHAATGWGHPGFGTGNQAPWLASPIIGNNPKINLGLRDGLPTVDGQRVTLKTTLGDIEVDAEKRDGSFVPMKKK